MNMIDRIADLSMIWKQTSEVFPYFDRNKIDWNMTYREYIAKVINAESDREFHLLLAEFINLLNDGHTDYIFPKTLRDEVGYLPFIMRHTQDTYCISAVLPEYHDFCGAEVLSMNGTPLTELVRQAGRYSYCVGNFATRIHQILPFLLKSKGNTAETTSGSFVFDLLPSPPAGLMPQPLELPLPHRRIESKKLDIRVYDDNILYIKLNDYMYSEAADEVREAMMKTEELKGIILDLRENIGGMTRYGAKIAELLIPGTFHACQKRTRSMTGVDLAGASQIARWNREDIEKHIAAGYSTREEMDETTSYISNTHYNRYVDTYGSENHTALFSGPCVILTSRYTISAAEDFIAMFRTNQRATIMGTETSGTTGTPLMQQLLCGGSIRVCSVGYKLMDGTEFVGCGIKPDIPCEASVEDLRRGYDSVLEKSICYLKNQITK